MNAMDETYQIWAYEDIHKEYNFRHRLIERGHTIDSAKAKIALIDNALTVDFVLRFLHFKETEQASCKLYFRKESDQLYFLKKTREKKDKILGLYFNKQTAEERLKYIKQHRPNLNLYICEKKRIDLRNLFMVNMPSLMASFRRELENIENQRMPGLIDDNNNTDDTDNNNTDDTDDDMPGLSED